MGSDYDDPGMVMSKQAGVGYLPQGGGTGGSSLWVVDVGKYPPHWPNPGGVLA